MEARCPSLDIAFAGQAQMQASQSLQPLSITYFFIVVLSSRSSGATPSGSFLKLINQP